MHRLITAKSFYTNSFHNISVLSNNFVKSSHTHIKCSFCRKFLLGRPDAENLLLSRHLSTRAANAVRSQKKRVKHKSYKKYGEVLQVGEEAMTEKKVSISKLKATHLSKLASSPVSLGQLHQLTAKPKKTVLKEVDPELLQSVKEKILKKSSPTSSTTFVTSSKKEILDDKCALIYTSHTFVGVEDRLKSDQVINMIKESYLNFKRSTLFDQRLQDLRFAISEGLHQEFDWEMQYGSDSTPNKGVTPLPKSPHAVFKELFIENQLDSYDHELLSHISTLQSQGLPHPILEEEYDSVLQNEVDPKEDCEFDHHEHEQVAEIKSFNVKKAKKSIHQKNKERREKRRIRQEMGMKEDLRDLERRGKRDALHRMLRAHMRLLCALDMTHEGRQVLQYYRVRHARAQEHPKVTDVTVYNTLLHGYAAQADLANVKELLTFMQEDEIAPVAQTYAAIFECIERSTEDNKLELLQTYYQDMQNKGITLNDLMDKSKFLYDQSDVVLKAIRRLSPDFEPQYTPPDLDYVCPLLEKLKLEKIENRQGLLVSPAEGLMGVEQMKEEGKRQLEIEIKGEIEVENIDIKSTNNDNIQFCRVKQRETEAEWRETIRAAFARNLSTLRSQSNASHAAVTLYPYLKAVDADQLVEMLMGEISRLVDGSETYSPTLKLLQRDLGTRVYHKYLIEQYRRNGVLEKIERIYGLYCDWYLNRRTLDGGTPYNARQAWQRIEHENRHGASLDIEEALWPMELRQNIGKFLYNIIINDVKIDVNMFKSSAKKRLLPAVYKVHRSCGRMVRLELKPHPIVCRVWAAGARPTLAMRASLLPTAAPPRPWTALHAGAYLLTPTPLVRLPYNVMSQWKRLQEAPPASLYPALDSLNQLGEVPWVINQPILDLQLKVFRSGGNKKLDIPPPGSALDTSQFALAEDAAGKFKRRIAINRARAEMHSLWCDSLYKLSLANHYRDRVFWLPHNMDFRGRVYACPPHVSQLGADTARALLKFAAKKPLGKDGLRWLKLHAINLTGLMKRETVEQRLEYAERVLDKILDSADHPLDGQGWWMESEEPWQTLACCMEIANAIRSPNHEEYECGFPVHQDGSCNGLQHYAALGGDRAGAAAVNLAPQPSPQDVYSAVAALVEEMRARDAAAGVAAAKVLEGFVRRKVIKQTVMTTVYGVTRFGARLQIAKQLKDIDDFPKDQVWVCSQYLTSRTFDSLREMFTSTKLIQDWFTDCAKVISGVCGESVEWVTPLGLPVVQPYYRRALPAHHPAPAVDMQKRPCTMKQRNAFPPNFIHSLDSTHMMLTALHCQAEGLSFVSVHDCFWTHPHTVSQMNKICREQFVALHSQPILNDLSDFLIKRYSYKKSELEDKTMGVNKKRVNMLLQRVPSKGDFDLESVLRSVYFFS